MGQATLGLNASGNQQPGTTFNGNGTTSYSSASGDGSANYSYDPTGQLIGASYSPLPRGEGQGVRASQANESYTWDANGNPANSGDVIGPDNELLSDGTYNYTYDAEGNRTAKFIDANADGVLSGGDTDITLYTWDNRERLVGVTSYASYSAEQAGTPTQVVDYLYDAENRWVGESVSVPGQPVEQIRFTYDGNQIVLEFEGTGTAPLTTANLSHRYLWQPGVVDQLMADERTGLDTSGNIVSNELLFALADQQGTVRDLAKVDAATGIASVADHIIYSSFGGLTSESDPSQGCLFKFTGRAADSLTGIEFHDERVKIAGSTDWMSVDPSGFTAGQTNPRDYCGNSPTNASDPSGLADEPSDAGARPAWTLQGSKKPGPEYAGPIPQSLLTASDWSA
jgi:RHS repeat-associated protein